MESGTMGAFECCSAGGQGDLERIFHAFHLWGMAGGAEGSVVEKTLGVMPVWSLGQISLCLGGHASRYAWGVWA